MLVYSGRAPELDVDAWKRVLAQWCTALWKRLRLNTHQLKHTLDFLSFDSYAALTSSAALEVPDVDALAAKHEQTVI
jgi:hypothetical protein